ncbi:MAG: NAD-dependent epimerase/dehydratase family protein [Planctomycetes bacterium]|nr:NAD-dependent epimerase/dehydratase family protein [Planctomycetota bacterium]
MPPIDVVTGGAGFIGSHLADLLLETGRQVRIIDDLSSGDRANVPEGAEFLEGDVLDLAERAVRGAGVVYHLAAIPSVPYSTEHPLESHRAVVETTLAVLAAGERAGVHRVVFASSSSVYGETPVLPLNERHEPRPVSPYAIGKLCAELYAQYWTEHRSLEAVSLRFFNVYGPRQDPRSPYAAVIPRFISRLLSGKPLEIFGDGHQTRDFIFVRDVARALMATGNVPSLASPCYNIASGRPTSVLDLARTMAGVAGESMPVEHLPPREGDIRRSWADVDRARIELGFRAETPIEAGLRATFQWFARRATPSAGVGR